jgi:hypothetical protein
MKLWAYGDSHTAGAELGYSKATLNKFRAIEKRYKHSNTTWNEMLIEKNEYSILLHPNIACSPEYSWAGQLANLLQADEYICRARPGWSNDGAVQFMLEDKDKWQDDDIIIWGVATPWRYTPASEDLHVDNHQPARFPKKVARVFMEYGPSDDTSRLWTQGLMHLAKTLHPNMYMVQMSKDDLTVNSYNTSESCCITDIGLGHMMSSGQGKYTTLPDTHYDRNCHKDYAEMIYKLLRM